MHNRRASTYFHIGDLIGSRQFVCTARSEPEPRFSALALIVHAATDMK